MYLSTNRPLTHWGRAGRVYASVNYAIIGSDNGLSPVGRQAVVWTNAYYCQLDPWKQTSVTLYSKFKHFHSRKCIWKCRLGNKCLPFCLGLNVFRWFEVVCFAISWLLNLFFSRFVSLVYPFSLGLLLCHWAAGAVAWRVNTLGRDKMDVVL